MARADRPRPETSAKTSGETYLRLAEMDLNDPEVYRRYVDRLYNVTDLDAAEISKMRQQLSFKEVDDHVHVIDDDTQGVIVPYGDARRLLEGIRNG